MKYIGDFKQPMAEGSGIQKEQIKLINYEKTIIYRIRRYTINGL
jgi:hypothetical protein